MTSRSTTRCSKLSLRAWGISKASSWRREAVDASALLVSQISEHLSARRQVAAPELAGHIERELTGLGMDDARIEMRVERRERANELGVDQVELFIETNAGEGMQPLKRVASGGELSRLTLAIQGASSGVATIHTAIYDEVDTGVGGEIAEAIGLTLTSGTRQPGDRHHTYATDRGPGRSPSRFRRSALRGAFVQASCPSQERSARRRSLECWGVPAPQSGWQTTQKSCFTEPAWRPDDAV